MSSHINITSHWGGPLPKDAIGKKKNRCDHNKRDDQKDKTTIRDMVKKPKPQLPKVLANARRPRPGHHFDTAIQVHYENGQHHCNV